MLPSVRRTSAASFPNLAAIFCPMHPLAGVLRRMARLFACAVMVLPCVSFAYAPVEYFYTPGVPGYFKTPEEACDNLNGHFYTSRKWEYHKADRDCWDGVYGAFVHSTPRCAPDGSEPRSAARENERCGGPFFWSVTTPVRDIEDDSCKIGNPVSVGTGAKAQTEIDIPGTEHVAPLQRSYHSNVRFAASDSFGPNWVHQWNRQIQVPTPSSETIAALRPDGSARTFRKSATGWASTSGRDTITPEPQTNGAIGWRYFHADDDSIEIYDARGRLLSISARNGQTTNLRYDPGGKLIEVVSHFGRRYRFQYDGAGRITSITDPTEQTTQYAYNQWGMLEFVTHPDGTRRTYHYEMSRYSTTNAKYLTGITDEAGVRFSTYTYDGDGRVTSTELAGGVNNRTLVYSNELTTARTYPRGTPATLYKQTRVGNRLLPSSIEGPVPEEGGAKSIAYDAAGNISGTVGFDGNETRYSHDAQGRETQRIEGYGTAAAKTTTTEWHPTWNLPLKIASPGRMDFFTYDSSGQTLSYSTNATNDQSGAAGFSAAQIGQRTGMRREYDASGLAVTALDTVDNAETARWTYTYDAAGNLATLTNPRGQTGRALSYDGAGRLLTAIDTAGRQIEIQYNSRGNMTRYQRGTDVVVYAYNQVGFLTTVSGPGTFRFELEYDDAHRVAAYWLPADVTPEVFSAISDNPFGRAAAAPSNAPQSKQKAGWLRSIWNIFKTWLESLFADANAQAGSPLVRNPVNRGGGQSGPGMAPRPAPADVLEQGNAAKHDPLLSYIDSVANRAGDAVLATIRHIGGTFYGASKLNVCDDGGDGGDCDRRYDIDVGNCQGVVKARYMIAGVKICLASAAQRYGECLRKGPAGITTPLAGFDTPL